MFLELIFKFSVYFLHFIHRVKSRLSVESTSTPLPGSQMQNHRSPVHTPTHSNLGEWSTCNLALTPSSIHSNGSCRTQTPNASPIHAELHTDINENSTHSRCPSSARSSQRRGHIWVQTEEAIPRPNFEPKNLLSLFEETTPWVKDCHLTFRGKVFFFFFTLKCEVKGTLCMNVPSSLLCWYELLLPFCNSPATASCIWKKKKIQAKGLNM